MKLTWIQIIFALTLVTAASCASSPGYPQALDAALKSEDSLISKVIRRADAHELQIIYTQIDRYNDSVIFEDFEFRVSPRDYFYPASTVKFPIAVLALEYIHQDPRLNLDTRYYVEGDTVEATFGEDIHKIFAVSDNDANNRLFELLGPDRINSRLKDLGAGPVRISHRLSVPDADEITTRPIIFYLNDSTSTTLTPSINTTPENLKLKKIKKGKAFYRGDSLITEAMDFSLKNYYPIRTQHEILKRVIFPGKYPHDQRFTISDSQRGFLLNAMQLVPRELNYNAKEYYDSYGKFFIYGDKTDPIPGHIQIFNKVGYAYGTLTDCAYIKDTEADVEFMITATILVNEDKIFNDDAYEYDAVGIPFLAALGREIYHYEKNRKK